MEVVVGVGVVSLMVVIGWCVLGIVSYLVTGMIEERGR